mgnify:FL=1
MTFFDLRPLLINCRKVGPAMPSINMWARNIFPAMKMLAVMLSAGFLLTACKTTEIAQPEPTAIGGQVVLGVASIDIINDYVAPSAKPYVDHLYAPSPAQQLSNWAGSILTPVDNRGNLLMTINRAALIEEKIAGGEGISSLFKNEQARLVRVELEGIFSFGHPDGNRSATLTVVARFESSIPQDSTPAEADTIRMNIIAEGIARFDQEFRKQLGSVTTDNWPFLDG